MTTRGIDYDRLTLKDAFDLAILVEEEARDRYEELAAQLTLHHTPAAAGFFTKMTGIEEKHRQQLQVEREKKFGSEPRSIQVELLYDIEAPGYDEVRAFMSLGDALRTALASEVKAHAFFTEAVRNVKDPDAKALFSELCEEELEHQALVKAELAKLDPTPNGNPNDYSDDPVAL
ncbi:MAG: Rubrerythrin [Myxococcaceae bacterium]|nr:Rubrerythrin [Myxococcaceae bacterium]